MQSVCVHRWRIYWEIADIAIYVFFTLYLGAHMQSHISQSYAFLSSFNAEILLFGVYV